MYLYAIFERAVGFVFCPTIGLYCEAFFYSRVADFAFAVALLRAGMSAVLASK